MVGPQYKRVSFAAPGIPWPHVGYDIRGSSIGAISMRDQRFATYARSTEQSTPFSPVWISDKLRRTSHVGIVMHFEYRSMRARPK
jgi:hypothetical protein